MLLGEVLLVHSNRLFGSFSLAEDVIGCYADFGGSSVKYAPSVHNSSTGNYPNWGAHLTGRILPLASWEALLFLVNFVLGVESTVFCILKVCGLPLLRGGLWYGLHPLHLDDELEQRMVVGQWYGVG